MSKTVETLQVTSSCSDSNTCYAPGWMAWSIWGLAALFYMIGFYHRVAPAVMIGELMNDFNIGAAALGNLSAIYFYSYVFMQIPTGLLADAWGPRRLLTAGTLVAAIGAVIFSLSENIFLAYLGRLLIGGSVAVAWVVVLKLANNWLPTRLFAMSSGLALICGVLGAVSAGVPLRLLVDHFGWRPVIFSSGVITLFLGAIIWIFVRDRPSSKGYSNLTLSGLPENLSPARANPLAGLGQVLKYRNTWLLLLAPGGTVGSILAFAGLWGVPFLQVRFGLTPAQSAAICSAIMISWALGSPVLGGLSDRMGRRKTLYMAGNAIATLLWIIILYVPGLSLSMFVIMGVLAGLSSGGMIIGFAFCKESVPQSLSGTVTGVVNMGLMAGPMLLQPLIGWFLDWSWKGNTIDGVRVYDLDSFQTAFLLMVAWCVLSSLLLAFTKETYCRQQT